MSTADEHRQVRTIVITLDAGTAAALDRICLFSGTPAGEMIASVIHERDQDWDEAWPDQYPTPWQLSGATEG